MVIFTVWDVLALSALKQHLQKIEFVKIELPEEGINFKSYKPGDKSLKVNTVIYASFTLHYL